MHSEMIELPQNDNEFSNPLTIAFCVVVLVFNLVVFSLMISQSYSEYQKIKIKKVSYEKDSSCAWDGTLEPKNIDSSKSQYDATNDCSIQLHEECEIEEELKIVTKRNTERNKIVGTLYSNIPVFEINSIHLTRTRACNRIGSNQVFEELITCQECVKMNQTHEGDHSFIIPITSEVKNCSSKGPKLQDGVKKAEYRQSEAFDLKQSEGVLCQMHERRLELLQQAHTLKSAKLKSTSKRVRFISK